MSLKDVDNVVEVVDQSTVNGGVSKTTEKSNEPKTFLEQQLEKEAKKQKTETPTLTELASAAKLKKDLYLIGAEGDLELDAATDRELFKILDRFHKLVNSGVLQENDPNVSYLNKMLAKHYDRLKARAQVIETEERRRAEMGRRERRQNKEEQEQLANARIFHGDEGDKKEESEAFRIALAVADFSRDLAVDAFACRITNNGQKRLETELSLEDFEVILEKARGSLPKRIHEAIGRLFEKEGKTLQGAAIAGVLTDVGGFIAAALTDGKLSPEWAAVLGVLAAVGGGITGYNWDFFVGHKEDKVKIGLSCPPTESRLITSYADYLGITGWNEAQIADYFVGIEKVRHEIAQKAGLDLRSANEIGMIDPEEFDPSHDTVTSGAGRVWLENAKQIALRELTQGKPLTEFSPEDRLRFKLEAQMIGLRKLCANTATAVNDELVYGEDKAKQQARETAAQKIEELAKQTESGEKHKQIDEQLFAGKKEEVKTAKREIARLQHYIGGEQEDGTIKEGLLDTARSEYEAAKRAYSKADAEYRAKASQYDLANPQSELGSRIAIRKECETVIIPTCINEIASTNISIEQAKEDIQTLELQIEQDKDGVMANYSAEVSQNKANLSAKQAEIDAIKTQIALEEQKGGQQDLTKVSSLKTELASKESELKILSDNLSNAENNLQEAKGRPVKLSAKKRELAALQTKLDTAQRRLDQTQNRLSSLDTQISTMRDSLSAAQAARDTASEEFDNKENSVNKILGAFGQNLNGSIGTREEDSALNREKYLESKRIALVANERELENLDKQQKGEASEEDKKIASGIRRIGTLNTQNEFFRIQNAILFNTRFEGTEDLLTSLFSPDDVGYDAWLKFLFSNNTSAADMVTNRQLVSKADMVMAAVDFWHLSNEYFGRDSNGDLILANVRNRIGEIKSLENKIAEAKAAGTRRVAGDEAALKTAREKNKSELDALYGQVAHLFGIDKFKTAEFASFLTDRLTAKAKALDPFGPSYEVARPNRAIRETGVAYQSSEYGTVFVEPAAPPSMSGGLEVDHGRITHKTPSEFRINGHKLELTISEIITRPEDTNDPNAIEGSLTVHINRVFWNAMPNTRPSLGFPVEFLVIYDTDGNKIEYDSADFDNFRDKVITHRFASITHGGFRDHLHSFVGDLDKLYFQSIGEMLVSLDKSQQAKLFRNYPGHVFHVGLDNYNIQWDNANNELRVTGGPARTPVNESLKDFYNNTIGPRPAADISAFYNFLGLNALRAMQNY